MNDKDEKIKELQKTIFQLQQENTDQQRRIDCLLMDKYPNIDIRSIYYELCSALDSFDKAKSACEILLGLK